MDRTIARAIVAGAALIAGLAAASPSTACLRTLQVQFASGSAEVADKDAIAGFLAVPTYGSGQMIAVRVSASVHDLARRRASALADLLQAFGLSPSGIKIETSKDQKERSAIIIHPPPHFVETTTPTAAAPSATRPVCGG